MILETSLKLKCLKGFRDLNGAIWRMYPVIGTYKTSLKLKCLKGFRAGVSMEQSGECIQLFEHTKQKRVGKDYSRNSQFLSNLVLSYVPYV